MNSWIIIPARGGSKTIPRKNMAPLAGRPLIDYVLMAAKAWGKAERVIVSTDDLDIWDRASSHGAIVAGRPELLRGDDVSIADVMADLLEQDKDWPDIIILLQPTSPFVLPSHMDMVMEAFNNVTPATISSFETIAECPHNHHAYNQRLIDDGVRWAQPMSREVHYNKQKKPLRYIFGNLLAFRPEKFMEKRDLFQRPTRYVLIDIPYAHDVDNKFDLVLAGAMIEKRIVKLEHMKGEYTHFHTGILP